MAALKDIEQTMHRVLRGEASVGEGAERLGVDPRRLSVYAGFVRQHVETALEKNFTALRSLLPAALWQRLSDAYFDVHPPAGWELNEAAEAFPGFLAARIDAGDEPDLAPFHISLAQLEWAQFASWVHPARIPDPADVDRPTLNPTLTVLELVCPTVRWLVRFEAGTLDPSAPLPTPAQGPELALVFRKRDGDARRVGYHVASDDLLLALKVAHDGLEVDAVAAAHGLDPAASHAAMARAVDIGLVIAPLG